MTERTLLVTGGAGFIGSTFVLDALRRGVARVVTLDKLTYAGNRQNLAACADDPNHIFVEGDICDSALVRRLFEEHRPNALVHFAAESHVDRSIEAPAAFVQTNVVGTFTLLEATRAYLAETRDSAFRFIHVSTDEVYGELGDEGYAREESRYAPRSPYAASKAASDHFVSAFHHTYGLPIIITQSSNNYGPGQFSEKLVPRMILQCVERKPLPVYGTGANVRDWIFVADHVRGIQCALERGRIGETYLFGGRHELTNLTMVRTICDVVDSLMGRPPGTSRKLIGFVADRPGHDYRYATDCTKAERELGWTRAHDFESSLRETVRWYLENRK